MSQKRSHLYASFLHPKEARIALFAMFFLLLSKLDLRRLMLGVKHSPQQGLGAQRNLREILVNNFQSFSEKMFHPIGFRLPFLTLGL